MSRMKLVSFSVRLREVWQKQANVTDNKYFTMRFPLPACNAYLLMGRFGNKAHRHHYTQPPSPFLPPPLPLRSEAAP